MVGQCPRYLVRQTEFLDEVLARAPQQCIHHREHASQERTSGLDRTFGFRFRLPDDQLHRASTMRCRGEQRIAPITGASLNVEQNRGPTSELLKAQASNSVLDRLDFSRQQLCTRALELARKPAAKVFTITRTPASPTSLKSAYCAARELRNKSS